jgi:hypothetical protein
MEKQVKDFSNWKKIVFKNKAILRIDLSLMSKEQRTAIEELYVLSDQDSGRILYV